jgi:hypothetical protein
LGTEGWEMSIFVLTEDVVVVDSVVVNVVSVVVVV